MKKFKKKKEPEILEAIAAPSHWWAEAKIGKQVKRFPIAFWLLVSDIGICAGCFDENSELVPLPPGKVKKFDTIVKFVYDPDFRLRGDFPPPDWPRWRN